jgi:uncharacterized membrane protein YdjX (TVP38/TMEM64 family)
MRHHTDRRQHGTASLSAPRHYRLHFGMRITRGFFARAAAVTVPVLVGLAGARLLSPWLPQFARMVQEMGWWGPAVFVAAYVVATLLMLPAFLLIIIGGAVFGMVTGSVLSMCGALLGGTGAFLVARHFARDIVARRVAAHPALAAIDRTIGKDGAKLVFLVRLASVVPFVLTNYALGVTRVRLRDFVIGTVGLIPTVLTYTAYGSASRALAGHGKPSVPPLLVLVGVSAAVVLGVWLSRIAQRAVRESQAAVAPMNS